MPNAWNLKDVADELVEWLNGGTYDLPVAAERRSVSSYDAERAPDLLVVVFPVASESVLASRSATSHKQRLGVSVQAKVASIENGDVDPFIDLVDELAERMRFVSLSVGTLDAVWLGNVINPFFEPELLKSSLVFWSTIVATFNVAAR